MSKEPVPYRELVRNADEAQRRLFGALAPEKAYQLRKRVAVSPADENRLALVDDIACREFTVLFEDDADVMQILVRDVERSNGRDMTMATRVVVGDASDADGRVHALVFDRKLRTVFGPPTLNVRPPTFDDVTWVEPVSVGGLAAYFIDVTLVDIGVFRIGPPTSEASWTRADAEWAAAYIRGVLAPRRPKMHRASRPRGEGDTGLGEGGLGVPARRPRTPTQPPFGEAHVIPPEDADKPRYL